MFSQDDFFGDNLHKLCVIIMEKMKQDPLQQFRNLTDSSQRVFQKRLTEYIKELPAEDWKYQIDEDFSFIVNHIILHSDNDYASLRCNEVVTEVQHIPKEAENIISASIINESTIREDI